MSFVNAKKTIVVAADLEGRCEAALDYARKIAGAYGARVVLAHGIDPLDYASVDDVPGSITEGMSTRARRARFHGSRSAARRDSQSL